MKIRRRYHFDGATLAFVGITLFLGAGAVTSQNNLLVVVFGLAFATIVVSGVLSGMMMLGLRVERDSPPVGAVGEPLAVRYRVSNTARRLPAFALWIREDDSGAGQESLERRRRLLGDWDARLLHVGPGEEGVASALVTPRARGEAPLVGVRVRSAFPFGLFPKSISCAHAQSILVFPRTVAIRRDALRALVTHAHTGHHAQTRRGAGVEFFGVREYKPGDSPRRVAWKRTARTGELVVREHAAPHAGVLEVLLNLNSPHERECEDAITLAASLACEALRMGIEVGLGVPAHGVRVEPTGGPKQQAAVLSALARIDLHSPPPARAPVGGTELDTARAACLAVHASAPDASFGPTGCRHIGAADAPALVDAGHRGGGGGGG
ncbi:MAG TPA: hypothetical protein DEB06_03590, partial [Phycisphaerales bacterium]|nr:hypothetical protein [Phycisphaerales bacterium]